MIIFYSGTERPSSMKMLKRARVPAVMFSYAQFETAKKKNWGLRYIKRRAKESR